MLCHKIVIHESPSLCQGKARGTVMEVLSIGSICELNASHMPAEHPSEDGSPECHALLRVHISTGSHACSLADKAAHPGYAGAATHQDQARDLARGRGIVFVE